MSNVKTSFRKSRSSMSGASPARAVYAARRTRILSVVVPAFGVALLAAAVTATPDAARGHAHPHPVNAHTLTPSRSLLRATGLRPARGDFDLWAPPAGAIIKVTSTAQSPGALGDCTLGEAIYAANQNAPIDRCTAGSGVDTILLPAGTYTLSTVDNTHERAGPFVSVIN